MDTHTYFWQGYEVVATGWIDAFFLINVELIKAGKSRQDTLMITRDDDKSKRVHTTGMYVTPYYP